jgi:pimeloyl-ACP methyl ester carboxylesterase
MLAAAGYRWVAPWLRGFGATRFLQEETLRDGTGVAIAQDALDLANALGWDKFAVVGHDWGGRAAYILAALAPERISSIASLAIGYAPRGQFVTPSFQQSRRWWYQWFMATACGAAAVRKDPIGFARMQWETWGPQNWFDEATFTSTSHSFLNPDWVSITLHGYQSRWRDGPLDARYSEARKRVGEVEQIKAPTLMLQGCADQCDPPSESEHQSRHFDGPYQRRLLDGVGHFPAREDPGSVGALVLEHLSCYRSHMGA